ncbi:hypothetical protein L596_002008 [Steinernema carpocapsae]|uniref:Uncharacterized protein n=1 Tax=Steinernema carpocapsae TaxID=34508 RepID=A0A4U8UMT2_STECR|nr:hypothetical protein L596_002008 [Steinernema carpocapsae]
MTTSSPSKRSDNCITTFRRQATRVPLLSVKSSRARSSNDSVEKSNWRGVRGEEFPHIVIFLGCRISWTPDILNVGDVGILETA